MNVFGMVTTRHSNTYTDHALRSLIANTKLGPDDQVVLIDNDGSYPGLPEEVRDRIRLYVNPSPRGFAANLNQAMDIARVHEADLAFLNNDMIFSPGWFEPLQEPGPFVLSPLSNVEVQHERKSLKCTYEMDLGDYLGKERLLVELVREHRKRARGHVKVISFPFFAVRIPFQVYSVVGSLDETFGVGGGEDKDYSIRSYLAGFELRYMLSSYVLHFQGKSTWHGAETADETAARDKVYTKRFREKWGERAYDLLVMQAEDKLPVDLQQAYKGGDFRPVIEALLSR
jgi:GT2 family glycosyltransferase